LQDPCETAPLPETSLVKKKGGPLGRILRGLTLKKDKDRSKSTDKMTSGRHLTPAKSLPPRVPDHVSNTVLYSDGTYASRDVRATAEERMKLVLMVKEGQISMEEAFEKMCQYEPQRFLTQDEVLRDFRHGFFNAGTKKPEIKETARFYTSVDGSYIQAAQKCQHWYDEPPYESDQDDGRKLGPMSLPNDTIKMANGCCVRESNVDTSSPPASWVYSGELNVTRLFEKLKEKLTVVQFPGDSVIMTRTAGDIQVTRDQIRSKTEEKRKDGSRLSNLSSASSKRDSLDSPREDGGTNSPVQTRKNKMLSKFKSITSRNHAINSASEEALSLSSDYEDQDHDENKKMERRLSRDVSGRASAFVGRVKGFGHDVRKKISKLRPSRTVSESEASEPNAKPEVSAATSASSVESLPSGSGSSVQALTTSSSNRSSTSVEEEVAPYSGPFIGRARALVDYTPSPYDKDALKFKKGDLIDIISMSQTGSWTGMLNNRVGHFKFINVEIIPEPKPRQRRSHLPKRRNSKRGKPKSVEELLQRINLEEHISVFVLNGYENLDLFKELEEDDLDYLGITLPEHRAKILTAVELLHDYDSPESPEGDEEPATDGESSTEQVDGHKQGNDERLQQSPRDSGCYASNENLPHRDSRGTNRSDKSKDYSLSSVVSNNLDCELSLGYQRTRDKSCIRNHVTQAIIEAIPKHDFQPNILPAATTDVEINKCVVEMRSMDDCDLGLKSSQSPLEMQGANSVIRREPTTTNPRSRSLDKTSLVLPTKNKGETNHRPNSLAQLPHKYSTLPRKLRLGKSSHDTNKKGLLKEPSVKAKAPTAEAENLQVILVRKLIDDTIDLTLEPYTDKTGFCGIPAALVQRYAEEVKHDVKEIANCLDCIRLQQLQKRGRQGVPNDFLADACSMYETNYSSLSSWLLSLGLPMYTEPLIQAGRSQLSDVVCLKESDLSSCGVSEPSHLRRLLIEIDALNLHLQ
uniref:SH3 domain-containing protein n=1 Tax=Strigamia maritima TaxID=126957 RepID=T1JIW4_STRMM